jgi:hypothetical protein
MTFMTHPQHGANNVSPSEVEAQEKAGWKVTDRDAWMGAKAPKKAEVSEIEPVNEPPAFVADKKKPGPKPKGR